MEDLERVPLPRFYTGDPRYACLNGIQAVAKGAWDGEAMGMRYPMVYELHLAPLQREAAHEAKA